MLRTGSSTVNIIRLARSASRKSTATTKSKPLINSEKKPVENPTSMRSAIIKNLNEYKNAKLSVVLNLMRPKGDRSAFLREFVEELHKDGSIDLYLNKIRDDLQDIINTLPSENTVDTLLLLDPDCKLFPWNVNFTAAQEKELLQKLSREKISALYESDHLTWMKFLRYRDNLELCFNIVGKEKIIQTYREPGTLLNDFQILNRSSFVNNLSLATLLKHHLGEEIFLNHFSSAYGVSSFLNRFDDSEKPSAAELLGDEKIKQYFKTIHDINLNEWRVDEKTKELIVGVLGREKVIDMMCQHPNGIIELSALMSMLVACDKNDTLKTDIDNELAETRQTIALLRQKVAFLVTLKTILPVEQDNNIHPSKLGLIHRLGRLTGAYAANKMNLFFLKKNSSQAPVEELKKESEDNRKRNSMRS